MYEQDYIMRMNRDVVRTIAKLVLNRDTELPTDITSDELNSEEKRMLESLYGQVDPGKIDELEKEILESVGSGRNRALEKALLFYACLNEQNDEFLLEYNYSREKIKSGLEYIASQYGISDIVSLSYF